MTAGRNEALLRTLLAGALLAALLVLWQSQLVAPSAGADRAFPGDRAFATLSRLLGEQVPHVAGTPANAVVRDRIVAELAAAGYAPEVQSAVSCYAADRNPGCTAVQNIVAVHKGRGDGRAVLVSAHYDSVPAGPGTSDDGAGAAIVIELARIFAARDTRNDIVFLVSDGEETGLRGAMAFAEHHPLMARVGAVVNVEARGTAGPSLMFETGPGNAALLSLYARAVARPSANSVSYEVYRLLPNDTDFSIYRRRGLTGFNFAFSGAASRYHSQRDSLRLLDADSLQHQGEHALEVAAALADVDLAAIRSDADASYFDVFGRALVVWPAALNVPLAAFAVLGIAALIVRRRAAFTVAGTLAAVGATVAVGGALFAAGWLLSWPLGIWPGVHPLDHPQPWPARVATVAAALAVATGIGALSRRNATTGWLLVVWLALALLALAVAVAVPGAAYPFLWPAVGFTVAAWTETLLAPRRESLAWSGWLGFVLAAFFCMSFVVALELVLGFDLTQYKILILLPVALALAPLFAGDAANARLPLGLCVAVTLGAAAVASRLPAYAPDHPRGLNVVYYDEKGAAPRWLIGFEGTPDEAFIATQGFPSRDAPYRALGLSDALGRFKPAPDLALAAPTLSIGQTETNGGTTVARGTLRTGRDGYLIGIGVAAGSGIRSLRIDGQPLAEPARLAGREPVVVRLWGVASRDIPVEIAYDAGTAPRVVVYERSMLPDAAEARALVAARPADAAPVQNGDSALVFVTVDLAPPAAAPR